MINLFTRVLILFLLLCSNAFAVGSWDTPGFRYTPQKTAQGDTDYNQIVISESRTSARLDKSIWAGDPAIAAALGAPVTTGTSFQDAITACGSSSTTLHVGRGTYSITGNMVVPANVCLVPEKGAVLSVATTKTLTINGPFEAGLYQVFTGAGSVLFGDGAVKTVNNYWFGAAVGGENATATQAAIDSIPATGGVTLLLAKSLYSSTVVVSKPNVVVDSNFNDQTWSTSYAKIGAGDYGIYNVMFAVTASNVKFINTSFTQGSFTSSGFYIWFALGTDGGVVDNCNFYDLLYSVAENGVCIQTRTTTTNTHIRNCYFENCRGAVVLQGSRSSIFNNISQNTDSNGGADAIYSIDAGDGNDMSHNQVYKAQACPVSGSVYQIAGSATNFTCSYNYLNGLKGGIGFYLSSYAGVYPKKGTVSHNTISGGNLTPTASFTMMRLLPGCQEIEVSNNKFIEMGTESVTSMALDISPGNNRALYNDIYLDPNKDLTWAIRVLPSLVASTTGAITTGTKSLVVADATGFKLNDNISIDGITGNRKITDITGTTITIDFNADNTVTGAKVITPAPGYLDIIGNSIRTASVGIYFSGFSANNNNLVPIKLRGNTYDSMLSPISTDGLVQNFPLWMENDNFTGPYINVFGTPVNDGKHNRQFAQGAYAAPYRIAGDVTSVYATELPTAGNYPGTSWGKGSTVFNPDTGTITICSLPGTFTAASTTGGITINTKILTVAAAAGFYPGDYITIAGVTGIKKIKYIVGNVMFIDTVADATVAAAAVVTPDPVF